MRSSVRVRAKVVCTSPLTPKIAARFVDLLLRFATRRTLSLRPRKRERLETSPPSPPSWADLIRPSITRASASKESSTREARQMDGRVEPAHDGGGIGGDGPPRLRASAGKTPAKILLRG